MTDSLTRLTVALADKYRIERELGQGGMATVYLAQDVKHDRQVALKVLRPELAAVIGAERFLAEIKTTANLQHPHILALFDSGTVDGTVFYVMPFVEGESLRDRIAREKQLPIEDALRIAHEVADALEYAHRHGVIHRDIKPENILLHGGHALVADFGIALAASKTGGSRMTETGMSLGTPHYMSPEQAMGERDLDARSDIYALGCVTYEMLTGEPPFSGTTAQAIVARVLTEAPRAMTLQRRTVPPHVEAAVLKALEKLPADRFGSAAEFDRALTTAGSGTAAVGKRGTRLDWRLALAAGVLLGAAAFWVVAREVHGGTGVIGGRPNQLTFNGRSWKPAISPDGDFVAFVDANCPHGNVDPCQTTLMVQEAGSARAVPVLTGALALSAPRWSHDGATMVVAGQLDSIRSGLFVVPRLGGSPRSIGAGGAFDTHPTGDTVVSVQTRMGRNAEALFISLASGNVIDSVAAPFRDAYDISWSPNGKFLAVRATDGRVMIVGRDGKQTGSLNFPARKTLRWNVRGDGVLAFRSAPVKEDDLVRIPVNSSGKITGPEELVMPRVATLYLGQFDIARRTGRMILATGDAIGDIWSVDLTPGKMTATQRTRGTTWYGSPSISPDGGTIYYFRGDALGDNVYAQSVKDGIEEALTTQRRPGSDGVHTSVDGRRLVYGHAGERGRFIEEMRFPSRTVSKHDVPGSSSMVWPLGEKGLLDASADGRQLMVADSLGGAWRVLPLPDSLALVSYAPSPDGQRVGFLATTPDGTMLFGTVPIAGGAARLLNGFTREPGNPRMTWDRDGTIYMPRWLAADDSPSLWTIAEATGAATRVATLPARCDPSSAFVAGTHHLLVCNVVDYRSDVWIFDGVGGRR